MREETLILRPMSDTLASNLRSALLDGIEKFCTERGLNEGTFGLRAAGDSRLVKRIRDGGNLTLATADRIEAFIASAPASSISPPRAEPCATARMIRREVAA